LDQDPGGPGVPEGNPASLHRAYPPQELQRRLAVLAYVPGAGAEHLLNAKTRRPGKAADETVRAFYEGTQRGDPQRKKIALVATAHYLVRVMWAMLSHGNTWQENPARAA
jgi:hypothetical protein